MPTITSLPHVRLTVTDLTASVGWYERTLGLNSRPDMSGSGLRRRLMPTELGWVLGLRAHQRTPAGEGFDEARVGLDRLSISCGDRAGVAARLAALDGADRRARVPRHVRRDSAQGYPVRGAA